MRKNLLLILLLLFSGATNAEEDVLQYFYLPELGKDHQPLLDQVVNHARNDELDIASRFSQTLLERTEAQASAKPNQFGQLMINHGILRAADKDFESALLAIESGLAIMEARGNPFDEQLVNGILAKAFAEMSLEKYDAAEESLFRAQHLIHRQDGVHSDEQFEIIRDLSNIHLMRRDIEAADRQQTFLLYLGEKAYGPDSVDLVPVLSDYGSYFANRASAEPDEQLSQKISVNSWGYVSIDSQQSERTTLFQRAINAHLRAIKIVEEAYGEDDLRLLGPLQKLGKARVLQMSNQKGAENAFLRILQILKSYPAATPVDIAQAQIALGDLYTIYLDAQAAETYLQAWELLQATPATRLLAKELFESPTRIYPGIVDTLTLDRAPADAEPGQPLFLDVRFNVSDRGRTESIEITAGNLTNSQSRMYRQIIQSARYRPRIVDGALAATEGLQLRQMFTVFDAGAPAVRRSDHTATAEVTSDAAAEPTSSPPE